MHGPRCMTSRPSVWDTTDLQKPLPLLFPPVVRSSGIRAPVAEIVGWPEPEPSENDAKQLADVTGRSVGVRGLPARGYFIPGRDGGDLVAGKSSVSSSRDRVVVARPGPGSAQPLFLFLPRFSNTFEMLDFGILVRFS